MILGVPLFSETSTWRIILGLGYVVRVFPPVYKPWTGHFGRGITPGDLLRHTKTGYEPLPKWDDPPSKPSVRNGVTWVAPKKKATGSILLLFFNTPQDTWQCVWELSKLRLTKTSWTFSGNRSWNTVETSPKNLYYEVCGNSYLTLPVFSFEKDRGVENSQFLLCGYWNQERCNFLLTSYASEHRRVSNILVTLSWVKVTLFGKFSSETSDRTVNLIYSTVFFAIHQNDQTFLSGWGSFTSPKNFLQIHPWSLTCPF